MDRIIRRKYNLKDKKMTKVILVFFLLAILLIIFLTTKVVSFYNKIHKNSTSTTNKIKENKTEYSLLFLGYGGGNHEGTYLTDTIMVAHVDLQKKKINLISIPRDIWVKVPTKNEAFHSKINAVYQMGIFPESYPDLDTKYLVGKDPSGFIKKVVFDVTGLSVDGYIAVDFQGFTNAIDTLGGIDIAVTRGFTDYEYPIDGKENEMCEREEDFKKVEPILKNEIRADDIKKLYTDKPELEVFVKQIKDEPQKAFPCRYETLTFSPGVSQMDGETALKFARSRHSQDDGGDFNRAQRQQLVLEATKTKILSLNFIPKIFSLMDDLGEHVSTDLSIADMQKLLKEANQGAEYTTKTFVISGDLLTDGYSDNGQYIITSKQGVDDWMVIKSNISNLIQGITPTLPPPSPTRVIIK